MAAVPGVWHPCYGPLMTLQLVRSTHMPEEPNHRAYPVEFEGERFYRGRTKVSGTADAPEPLHRGDQVAHLVISHVQDVKLGLFENVPTVLYGLNANESYQVPLDQVDSLLAEARRLARKREEEATGQQPLLDELADERDAESAFPVPGDPLPGGDLAAQLTAAQANALEVIVREQDAGRQAHTSRSTDAEQGTVNSAAATKLLELGVVAEDDHGGFTAVQVSRDVLAAYHAGDASAAAVQALEDAAPDPDPDDLPEGVTRLGDAL